MRLLRQSPPTKSRSAPTRSMFSNFGVGNILRNAGRLTAVLALAAIAACKESSTESGAIAVVIAPGAVTTTPGAPGLATVNVTRGGSFMGDVTLAAEGLPTGVTATFAPATLASGVATSSLTLTAGSTAVSGTSTVTIRASGSGVTARTTTMQVIVNASGVTLTAGAATATTTQGAAATVALTLARLGGFTGSVNLSASGLPANVTANFTPSTLGTGVSNSTLTLAAASNAPVGTTTISVRASGGGIADQLLSLPLVITTGAQPDFTLTATPAAVSVSPGGVVTSAIAINRTGGFIDNIGFVTSTLPQGVVATFTPNPANANTATLSFATTAQVTSGTFSITVTGSGGTISSRTVNIMLTVSPPVGITMTLNPVTTSVNVSGSVQNTVTITRNGGFTNDITFAGQNLPNGITLAFSPATLSGAATTTQATISAGPNVAPGLYTITLRADGVGSLVSTTATLNMTVIAPLSFSVALVSSTISIAAGGTGSITANLTRNGGFTGAVNLAVSGLPLGVTATVTPAAATGNTATINLTVGASTAAGTYNGVLNGTATGLPSTATNFTVTVAGGGGGGGGTGNIRWQFCSATGLPTFVAFKNGDGGTWTRVVPNASNLYSFDVTQPEGGVFIVKPSGGSFATTIYLQTRAELEAIAANECATTPTGFKSFTGSVVALSALETANVTMGGGSATATFGSLNYTLNNVLNGTQDLVALRNTVGMSGFVTDKILIRRNLNLNAGAVIAPLNFASAEAFNPISATVTLGNLGGDNATLATLFQTQNGGSVALGFSTPSTTTDRSVIGVPQANLAGTDLHALLAIATSADLTSIRNVFNYTNALSGANVSFGAVLGQPAVTSVTNTISRPRAQGSFQADYPSGIGMAFTQGAKSVTFTASRGYFSGSSYNLEYPDLTSIQQFDPQWGLNTSTLTSYTITGTNAVSGNIGNGTSFRTASRTGSYTSSAIRR